MTRIRKNTKIPAPKMVGTINKNRLRIYFVKNSYLRRNETRVKSRILLYFSRNFSNVIFGQPTCFQKLKYPIENEWLVGERVRRLLERHYCPFSPNFFCFFFVKPRETMRWDSAKYDFKSSSESPGVPYFCIHFMPRDAR